MSSPTIPPTLANPRVAELQQALSSATSLAQVCGTRLDDVTSAMAAHAWVSHLADAFFTDLRGNAKAATAAGDGCVENVKAALANCPPTVPNPAAKEHH